MRTTEPPEMTPGARPVRLAVVDEVELVVQGLRAMLAPYQDRVRAAFVGSEQALDADVVLCDPARVSSHASVLDRLESLRPAKVLLYAWNLGGSSVQRGLAAGAHGVVSKAVSAQQLVEAVEAAHRGEALPLDTTERPPDVVEFPGLSMRESQVLTLICRGLSNLEIAADLYVSVNSVKTYIRQIYQKAGVSRRTQAVAWAHRHGFDG